MISGICQVPSQRLAPTCIAPSKWKHGRDAENACVHMTGRKREEGSKVSGTHDMAWRHKEPEALETNDMHLRVLEMNVA